MKKIGKKIAQYYLWCLAKFTLYRFRPSIIAVTGSTYRQVVKEEILKALEEKFRLRMSPKNYNAEIGVPMSILGITIDKGSKLSWLKLLLFEAPKIAFGNKKFPEKLILELAIDKPKDMDYLLTLIKPEVVAITNITNEYIDNFGSLDKIAKEYLKLIKQAPNNGLALLNYDDLRLKELSHVKPQAITYGLTNEAKFYPQEIEHLNSGQSFKLKINDKILSFQLNKFG
ncbi:MAG: Mur ligase family protein, partial [bacterium]